MCRQGSASEQPLTSRVFLHLKRVLYRRRSKWLNYKGGAIELRCLLRCGKSCTARQRRVTNSQSPQQITSLVRLDCIGHHPTRPRTLSYTFKAWLEKDLPAVFGTNGSTAAATPRVLLSSAFSVPVCLNFLLILRTVTAAQKSIASHPVLRQAVRWRARARERPLAARLWCFGTGMARRTGG